MFSPQTVQRWPSQKRIKIFKAIGLRQIAQASSGDARLPMVGRLSRHPSHGICPSSRLSSCWSGCTVSTAAHQVAARSQRSASPRASLQSPPVSQLIHSEAARPAQWTDIVQSNEDRPDELRTYWALPPLPCQFRIDLKRYDFLSRLLRHLYTSQHPALCSTSPA